MRTSKLSATVLGAIIAGVASTAIISAAQAAPVRFGMSCDIYLGEGSGPTPDTCLSYYPESISQIVFYGAFNAQWTIDVPPGEPLRIQSGCVPSSNQCAIMVSPRCDAGTRTYTATARRYQNGVLFDEGIAVATVPPSCAAAPPPPTPVPTPPQPPASPITISCQGLPGSGSGATANACTAAHPENISAVRFEVLPNAFENDNTIYVWSIEGAPGEPVAVQSGCRNERVCTLDVRPKTGGAPRVYRASVYMTEEFQLERGQRASATATVPAAPGPGLAIGPAELTINPIGGAITLPDLASVVFPNGALYNATQVRLEGTQLADTADDWETSAAIYGATNRTLNEIRITLSEPTLTPIAVTLKVPPGYSIAPQTTLQAFAQLYTSSGQDVLDRFEILDSVYSEQDATVRLSLPVEAFAERRDGQPGFEAILLLATTPRAQPTPATAMPLAAVGSPATANLGVESMSGDFAMAAIDGCNGPDLGPPLDRIKVNSNFGDKGHGGTDFDATIGTPVRAVADGTIELVKINEKRLTKADPRSKLFVKGYGQYVVIKHDNSPATSLYGHLQQGSVRKRKGDRVMKGEIIGLSGNSGGSTGPHLHLEYIPDGQTFNRPSKADPAPCIVPNPTPTNPTQPTGTPTRVVNITIGDWGNLKDDRFRLSVNGIPICETRAGEALNCRVPGVSRGSITAVVTCLEAPDGVGTLAIQLGSGLRFANGSTFVSGELKQGESVTLPISVQ